MATFGHVGEFDGGKESWTVYVERLEAFFDANDITDSAKKRSVLIAVVGSDTYGLIRNLVSPAKPKEKSFAEIVKLVEQHKNPEKSEIVERVKFNKLERKDGQSVADFVAELKSQAAHCKFGGNLNIMLRDRLVCGIRHEKIQSELLSQKSSDLTFEKAHELALSVEVAAAGAKDIAAGASSSQQASVSYVKRVRTPGKSFAAFSKTECVSWKV